MNITLAAKLFSSADNLARYYNRRKSNRVDEIIILFSFGSRSWLFGRIFLIFMCGAARCRCVRRARHACEVRAKAEGKAQGKEKMRNVRRASAAKIP